MNQTITPEPASSPHRHNCRTTAAVRLPHSQPYTIPAAALAPSAAHSPTPGAHSPRATYSRSAAVEMRGVWESTGGRISAPALLCNTCACVRMKATETRYTCSKEHATRVRPILAKTPYLTKIMMILMLCIKWISSICCAWRKVAKRFLSVRVVKWL